MPCKVMLIIHYHTNQIPPKREFVKIIQTLCIINKFISNYLQIIACHNSALIIYDYLIWEGGYNSMNSFAKKIKKNRSLLIMLLPAVLYVTIFSYIPMTGIIIAFKKYNYQAGILGSKWAGFDNFRYMM